MAKARYSRAFLEKTLKLDEKTLKRINLLGTTVETIDEKDIELEIPANRPDLLSSSGFMRVLKAFEGKETGLKEYKVSTKKNYTLTVNKSVKPIRPAVACAVVEDITFTSEAIAELIALQEKLHATVGRARKKAAIGIYPLEKITFPLVYEARKPSDIVFTPLESSKPMTGDEILQKHPVGKEYASLLSSYQKYPVFVDAHKNILSLTPIINSEETGRVTEKTKAVFIECTGSDRETLEKIVIILTTELADRGGTIHAVKIKDDQSYSTPRFDLRITKLKRENVENLLGLKLSEKELSTLLARMGHEYKSGVVQSPAWRTDILHEVDLIEDVAIAYGYDKLIPELPSIATLGKGSPLASSKSRIREILNGLGMLELSSLHLVTKEEIERTDESKAIEVENPRTEYAFLRPSLTVPMLRTLATNRDAEYPQNLYELGPVFTSDDEEDTGVKEEEHLVIALTPGNFTKAKEVLDYLTRMCGLTYTLKDADHKQFIPGRTGTIVINDKVVGHFGEIHPTTLQAWKLKMPLALLELTLEPFLVK